MRVLIPELAEDAATIAAAMTAQGHEVLAVPSITMTPAAETPVNLSGAQAFLAESPAAARALAARVGVRTFPVFADSAVTADALRRLGFKNVEAANDARELANVVGMRLKPAAGALIHPCAAGAPSNLAAVLTNMGFAVRPLPLYSLTRISEAPPALREALIAGAIDAAVFTTAEAARALVTVLQRSELSTHARNISALAATATVAAPLRGLNLRSIAVLEKSDEAGLLAAITAMAAERGATAAAERERKRLEAEQAAARAEEEERRKRAAAEATEHERKRLEAEREAAAAAAERERKRLEAERAAAQAAEDARRKREAAEAAERGCKRIEAEREAAAAAEQERKRLEAEQAAAQAAEDARRKREAAEAAERERKRIEAEREAAAAAERERKRLEAERAAAQAAEEERRKREAAEAAERERKRVEAEREAAAAAERERKRLEAERAAAQAAEEARRKREAAEAAERERNRLEAEREAAAAAERERKRLEAERAAAQAAEEERRKREAAEAAERERKRIEAEREAAAAAERERKRLEAERAAAQAAEEERHKREAAEAAERERKRLEAEREAAAAAERERKRLEAERAAAQAAEEERRKREAAEAAERERKRVEAEREAAAAAERERKRLEAERAAAQAAEEERRKREAAEAAERERKRLEAEREAAEAVERERKRLEAERAAARAEEERRKREAAEAAERERNRLEAEREAAAAVAERERKRLEAEHAAAKAAEKQQRKQDAAEAAKRERARQNEERIAVVTAQQARDRVESERAAERAAQQAKQDQTMAEAAQRERRGMAADFADALADGQAQRRREAAEVAQRERERQKAERTRKVALARADAERLASIRRADEDAARAQREAAAQRRTEPPRPNTPSPQPSPRGGEGAERSEAVRGMYQGARADTLSPELAVSSADETNTRAAFAHRINRWLEQWKRSDEKVRSDVSDDAGSGGPAFHTPPKPSHIAAKLEKPKQDDPVSSVPRERSVPEAPPSVRLELRPPLQTVPDLPLVTPPGAMTQDQSTPAINDAGEPSAPAGTAADPGSPRQLGRAARLQAEDAADAVRAPRWRGLAGAGEDTASDKSSAFAEVPGDVPVDEHARRRTVRPGVVVFVLVIFAIAATAPAWLPRLGFSHRGPAQTNQSADRSTNGNEQATPLVATSDTQIAANSEPAPNATAAFGDVVGTQAKQIALLTARIETLEGALGNTAHLDELNRRLTALEGKSADANSVLALSDRVSALETTSRGAIAEQTARVALILAVAQWRDALAAGRPFVLELESVKALAGRAAETLSGLDDPRFTSQASAGIATTALLRERFDDTASSVLRAAAVPGGFNGFWGRSLERMMSIITIRRTDGLVEGNTPSAILARAGSFLKDGNLAAAVTEMEQLDGSAATAAQPWLDEARARVAAEQAVAAATSTALGAIASAPGAQGPASQGLTSQGPASRDAAPAPK